jgi:hypothetical protein
MRFPGQRPGRVGLRFFDRSPAGDAVVTDLRERLKVRRVEEQLRVAVMRAQVMHDGGRRPKPQLQAGAVVTLTRRPGRQDVATQVLPAGRVVELAVNSVATEAALLVLYTGMGGTAATDSGALWTARCGTRADEGIHTAHTRLVPARVLSRTRSELGSIGDGEPIATL